MKSTEARCYLPEVSPEMAEMIASGEFKGNMGDLADGKYTSDFAAKIKSLSRVERIARPLEIPQILRDLPGDSEVIVRDGGGDSVQSVWLTLSMIEGQMERQARGRYELNEVAEILASVSKDANGLDATIDGIAQGMKHAFEKGLLRFFDANGLWIDPENKDEDFLLYLGWYGDYTTPQAVNSWLESTGSPHRFPESEPAVPPDTVLMPSQATALPMKKAGLVKACIHRWPTIEADLGDASRNGLSVAKAGNRGWDERKALEWARSSGKLNMESIAPTPEPADPMAAHFGRLGKLPSHRHGG